MEELLKLFDQSAFGQTLVSAQRLYATMMRLSEADKTLAVRFVRGKRMQTELDVLDEFAAAWQFPWYYGRNWNAFDECIRDAYQWIEGKHFLTVILDSDALLAQAAPDALEALMRHLKRTTDDYSQPITRGEWWDRPSIWFRTLFHCDALHWRECQKQFEPFKTEIADIPPSIYGATNNNLG